MYTDGSCTRGRVSFTEDARHRCYRAFNIRIGVTACINPQEGRKGPMVYLLPEIDFGDQEGRLSIAPHRGMHRYVVRQRMVFRVGRKFGILSGESQGVRQGEDNFHHKVWSFFILRP